MHIGSITKVLNATLVMQLVDEGRVELTASLKRYLPDFQVADRTATERITVEMLLNHTCGIDGEYFPDAGPDAERIEDVIPRIARQGQVHAPGAEVSYCNAGAVLAGYLAQRLLRKSWYTLVEERIFKPLELRHSVVQPAHALLHRATVGHFLSKDGTNTRTSFAFLNPSFAPAGATAMLAAKDLATFALAHVNDGVGTNGHRLLSAASARRMRQQTAAWRGVGGGGVGLGWMTLDKGILGHDGGGPGIVSWLYADPAAKTVAAVLTNAAHGVPVLDDITAPLYEAAGAKPFGADVDELAKQVTDSPVDPHAFVGQYESVASAFRVIPDEKVSRSGCVSSCSSTTATHWRSRHRFHCARSATATSRPGRASSRSLIQAPTGGCSTCSLADACTSEAGERGDQLAEIAERRFLTAGPYADHSDCRRVCP